MKNLFVLIVLLATLPAHAGGCRIPGLPKIIGLDYHHARADLIVAGFMPVFQRHRPEEHPPHEFTRAHALGYFETMICGGTGNAGCDFFFSGNGKKFSVETTGCEFLEGACRVHRITCL